MPVGLVTAATVLVAEADGLPGGAVVFAPELPNMLADIAVDGEGLSALAFVHRLVPVPVAPMLGPDPILPESVAMGTGRRRSSGALIWQPPAHAGPDGYCSGWLPGLERNPEGPCLPLALYDMGAGRRRVQRGPAALALRLWVEAALSASGAPNRPEALEISLRELLRWFYPGRAPSPAHYWPLLNAAARVLDRQDVRVPWLNPRTGKGGLRRVVSVGDIPRGPGALDDCVRLVVDLPPGSERGPVVNRVRLRHWGARSATAYRAMIGLAYRWHQPGVTRYPVRGGKHWLQSHDPTRYEPLSNSQAVGLCYPAGVSFGRRRDEVRKAWDTLRRLAKAGDVRIDGRRILPPRRP